MKEVKVDWCRNFIIKTFAKFLPHATGIEANYFFDMAEKAGLYVKDTYGGPMSQALAELVTVEVIKDSGGQYLFRTFKLKL